MAQSAIDMTTSIVTEYGPRLTTSPSCQQVAQSLHRSLSECCDSAVAEPFETTPHGMPNIARFLVVGYISTLLFLWLNLPTLASLIQSFFLLIFIFEFLFYWETLDRLTPHRTATNVYGTIEPTHNVNQIILFSGHHDSAHIFNFFADMLGRPWMFMMREIPFISLHIAQLAYSLYTAFAKSSCGFSSRTPFDWFAIILLTIALRLAVLFWWFESDTGTPGAGDNLISSVMGVELAKFYSKHKPKHTRLVFVSFDAEELGLKGSRQFFRAHKGELNAVKTYHFNVDCPYTTDELKFLTRDVNGFVRLSAGLAGKLAEIARDLGYGEAKTTPIMFLGGGTDAGEAARAGIEATTLLGMPFGPRTSKGKTVVYHTELDTMDAVEPEIVKATMDVFGRFVDEVDNNRWPL